MAEEVVNIYEAKTHFSQLVVRVEDGQEVVIARAGKPVARLIKWEPRAPRKPGIWKGEVLIGPDFDEFSDADTQEWYGTP